MEQSQNPYCHSFPPVQQHYYQVTTLYQVTPGSQTGTWNLHDFLHKNMLVYRSNYNHKKYAIGIDPKTSIFSSIISLYLILLLSNLINRHQQQVSLYLNGIYLFTYLFVVQLTMLLVIQAIHKSSHDSMRVNSELGRVLQEVVNA